MTVKLEAVIRTLNDIEVHGKNNLDMLLGCIMTLEQIQKDLAKEEVKKPDGR